MKVVEYFKYVDGYLVWAIAPTPRIKVGDVAGRVRSDGYREVGVCGRQYKVHRLVWELHHGEIPTGMHVDHINHDKSDNRLVNLRLVTRTENNRNATLSKRSKSGIPGVTWCKTVGRWKVQIGGGRGRQHICYSKDFVEACSARIYEEVSRGYHPNHGKS